MFFVSSAFAVGNQKVPLIPPIDIKVECEAIVKIMKIIKFLELIEDQNPEWFKEGKDG